MNDLVYQQALDVGAEVGISALLPQAVDHTSSASPRSKRSLRVIIIWSPPHFVNAGKELWRYRRTKESLPHGTAAPACGGWR
jgi:hypothetical protein